MHRSVPNDTRTSSSTHSSRPEGANVVAAERARNLTGEHGRRSLPGTPTPLLLHRLMHCLIHRQRRCFHAVVCRATDWFDVSRPVHHIWVRKAMPLYAPGDSLICFYVVLHRCRCEAVIDPKRACGGLRSDAAAVSWSMEPGVQPFKGVLGWSDTPYARIVLIARGSGSAGSGRAKFDRLGGRPIVY